MKREKEYSALEYQSKLTITETHFCSITLIKTKLRQCYGRTIVTVIVVTPKNKFIPPENACLHFLGHSQKQKIS